MNASGGGLKELEKFLTEAKSGSAQFTQTVTPPPRVGEAAPRNKVSAGRFEFARPDRFRFEYTKPFPQTIVADGKTLWLYDADLNQVTQKPQAQALGSAPAALVASSASLAKLAEAFDLKEESDSAGMGWVQATPKQAEGTLRRIRVGLTDGVLAVLEMEDSFGQRSVLKFDGFKANPGFAAQHFQFKPPAGADVLKP
jgi:outer membrane lipoprotein carrier protein